METRRPLSFLSLVTGSWFLVTGATGCAHLPLDAQYRGPLGLPREIAAYYTYPQTTPQATSELLEVRSRYRRLLVRFPLTTPDVEPTEPVVEFEWFEVTRPGRHPAILFSPILGGDYPLERGICRFFAAHGFHVALVHRKTLKVSPEKDAKYLELLLRQAILRNRQILDWVASHPQVDSTRLGGFGISMGGIANFMTAAVDPRLRCHVVALAGGSLADILRDSHDKLIAKPRAKYLAAHRLDPATMHAILAEQLKTDPLRLAPYVDSRQLLMVIALIDRTIGTPNALRLWKAAGRPEAVLIPLGHYTTYLVLPYLKYASLRFFQTHLLTP